MRVATIDIGTNTVLLLVAEKRHDGDLVALEERAAVTRLGQGVDRTRVLAPQAMERTVACLDDFAKVIGEHHVDKIDVVGTSAMRDAEGGDAIREHVRRTLGVDARVIDGDEEARLTFAGALSGLRDLETGAHATVFDIGGGSTEVVSGRIVNGRADIEFARSYDVGSVRMTERYVQNDPPTLAELEAVVSDVQATVATLPQLPEGEIPVGIAGTVTTLAAVALEMEPYDGARVHGSMFKVADLESLVARLASMKVEQRRGLRGMEPKRADVIVSGGLIATAILSRLGAKAVRVSDRGVRWGLALALCT